ncbi:MAG: hypothetical protein KatS3mg028_1111 [Bacteroidia bacterium]|nr:MAG: hypothetical protein KatS3mg028_1111 [Bacteroidia bacterium]
MPVEGELYFTGFEKMKIGDSKNTRINQYVVG